MEIFIRRFVVAALCALPCAGIAKTPLESQGIAFTEGDDAKTALHLFIDASRSGVYGNERPNVTLAPGPPARKLPAKEAPHARDKTRRPAHSRRSSLHVRP